MKERAVIIAGYDMYEDTSPPAPAHPRGASKCTQRHCHRADPNPIRHQSDATRSQGGDLPINHLKTSIALPKGLEDVDTLNRATAPNWGGTVISARPNNATWRKFEVERGLATL